MGTEAGGRGAGAGAGAGPDLRGGWDLGLGPGLEEAFEVGKHRLGAGAFGEVFRARPIRGGGFCHLKACAVKVQPKSSIASQQDVEYLKLEVLVMRRLSNSLNVVHMIEAYEDSQNVYIVLELCTGGDLLQRIMKHSVFTEADARTYCEDILRMADQCHSVGVVHRDIKPGNFLLANKSREAPLKMTDFGLAAVYDGTPLTEPAGTPYYMAPELFQRRPYGPPADIWSCGCMLHFLFTGRAPFEPGPDSSERMTFQLLKKKVCKDNVDFMAPPLNRISPEARDLLEQLLAKNPSDRPSAEAAMRHPWFQGTKMESLSPGGGAKGSFLEGHMVQRLQLAAGNNSMKKQAIVLLVQALESKEMSDLRALFKQIDKDGNGLITDDELMGGLKEGGYVLTAEEAMWLMRGVDVNSDGKLDVDEFCACMIDLRRTQSTAVWEEFVAGLFSRVDADGSGSVELKELLHFMPECLEGGEETLQAAEDALREADLDGDGVVSFDEFKEMLNEADRSIERFDKRLAERYSPRASENDFREHHGRWGAWAGKGVGNLQVKTRALQAFKKAKAKKGGGRD